MSNRTTPQFRTIQKRTLSGEVVEQILSMIHSNQLQPGDRLPLERELCRAFNIGRSSVREAIKILETTGLVRTTTRGKEICQPRSAKIPAFNLPADLTNIREVFEARKAIEIELAGLAAERASPEGIGAMRQALVAENASGSVVAAGDIAFHRVLARSAHNSVLRRSTTPLPVCFFSISSITRCRGRAAKKIPSNSFGGSTRTTWTSLRRSRPVTSSARGSRCRCISTGPKPGCSPRSMNHTWPQTMLRL